MNPQYAYHIAVLALAGLVAWNLQGKGERPWGGLIMAVIVIALAAAGYSNFGRGHGANYRGNYHFSEFWHYYLGSKYSKELGPYGIYEATAAAKEEVGVPQAEPRIRDIKNLMLMVPIKDGIANFREEGQTRFTPERWEHYKKDVRALWDSSGQKYWPMHDAGYNPPPSYSYLVGMISTAIPVTPWTIYIFPIFDWALALAGVTLILRTFGLTPAFLFAVVYLTNPLSNWQWIGGGYMRNLELFCVTGALCALRKNNFLLAGAALGTATGARIFPIVFMFGAMLPLLRFWIQNPEESHWKGPAKMVAGFLAALGVMILGSFATQGNEAIPNWKGCAEKILNHGDVFFTYHIGAKKLASQTIEDPNQWFDVLSPEGEIQGFDEWNALQRKKLHENWRAWWIASIGLWGLIALVCSTEQPRTSMVLLGEATLFFFTLPANYYYVLLAAFTANAATDPDKQNHTWRIGIPVIALILLNLSWFFSNDPIVINHYHNLILGIMIVSYAGLALATQMESRGWADLRVRKTAVGSVLFFLIPLGFLTWNPRDTPETRTREVLTWRDFQVVAGEAWPQFLPEFRDRILKTQLTVKVPSSGEISLAGSFLPDKEGEAEIVIYYTSAPDYTKTIEISVGNRSVLLETLSPQVEMKRASFRAFLNRGETRVTVRSKGVPGELLGINSVLVKSLF